MLKPMMRSWMSKCLTSGVGKRFDSETEDFVVSFHPTQDTISNTDGLSHSVGCGSSHGQATVAVAHPIPFGVSEAADVAPEVVSEGLEIAV
jgi:hypothetical protein